MKQSEIKKTSENHKKIIIPYNEKSKFSLESIGIPHSFIANEFVVIEKDAAESLLANIGATSKEEIE